MNLINICSLDDSVIMFYTYIILYIYIVVLQYIYISCNTTVCSAQIYIYTFISFIYNLWAKCSEKLVKINI